MTTTPTNIKEFAGAILDPLGTSVFSFIQNNPFLWFAIAALFVVLFILKALAELIPQIEIFWSKLIRPIAETYKHRSLVKAAAKSDIVGHVNKELVKLRAELPKGWVPDLQVKWVTVENKRKFLDEDEMVLRIRPLENQEKNFVNTTYYFLRKNFFPKTRGIIPRGHQTASVLYVAKKVINNRTPEAISIFEDTILEPAVRADLSIPALFDDYEKLDQRGFYTGTFLRELQEVAKEVRFTTQRRNISQEASSILRHIKDFMGPLGEHRPIPNPMWSQIGPVSSYGLLLVARPESAFRGDVTPFVNRAKERFAQGAQRLYVFGANQEADFVRKVIAAIEQQVPEYYLTETFSLSSDYRGEKQGLGALFINRQSVQF